MRIFTDVIRKIRLSKTCSDYSLLPNILAHFVFVCNILMKINVSNVDKASEIGYTNIATYNAGPQWFRRGL